MSCELQPLFTWENSGEVTDWQTAAGREEQNATERAWRKCARIDFTDRVAVGPSVYRLGGGTIAQ